MQIRAVSSLNQDLDLNATGKSYEISTEMFQANSNSDAGKGTSVDSPRQNKNYTCTEIKDNSIKYNGSSKDGYIIKDGNGNELAFLCTDTGWFSCDQILGITSGGKYDGHCFKFRCTDDDKLNADEFCWDSTMKTYKSKNGYKVKQLECQDDTSIILPARTTGKGAILVQVDNKWLTLEEFMAYDPD